MREEERWGMKIKEKQEAGRRGQRQEGYKDEEQ
jgi:hypothetical protein